MQYFPNLIFALALITGFGFFGLNIRKLYRNINFGKDVDRKDRKSERLKNMMMIALGQSKMVKRPLSGFLHIIVYVGFVIINIEVLEIIIDGLFGTHRVFLGVLSTELYGFLIGTFEVLAALVFIAVVLFWLRRNVSNIKRFLSKEMNGWPKKDGNNILYFEMVLMSLFLIMNATDKQLQILGAEHYIKAGSFPISSFLLPLFENLSQSSLIILERSAWWLHITGIFIFLNYLYFSKHLHILLAFPNVYYGSVSPKGKFKNLASVTNEVKLMMDPTVDPFAAPAEGISDPAKFGASDVLDLSRTQLLNAYTCTECGRCTSNCPANQTGKKLSPRKIMMDTRDRLEEVGKNIDTDGVFIPDNKQLLGDHITKEELWACTSCQACVDACPINISPMGIILDMRRSLIMEDSKSPEPITTMFNNIENIYIY